MQIKYCGYCGAVCDVDDRECGECIANELGHNKKRFYTLDEVIRMVIRENSGVDKD